MEKDDEINSFMYFFKKIPSDVFVDQKRFLSNIIGMDEAFQAYLKHRHTKMNYLNQGFI